MPLQTAVIIGATGLIGSYAVSELLNDDAFGEVIVLVRREFGLKHAKLKARVVDFNDMEDYKNKLGTGTAIFSCIGTTQKKVKGDRAAYRKIDFDITVNAAKLGKDLGFNTFLFVSAIGANAKAGNFYLKLKGEVEDAVAAVGLNSVHIFQPSMLLGNRNEKRFGESVMQGVMKGISFSLAGKLRKYRPVEALTVAKAMVVAAKNNIAGKHVYVYDEIIALAKSNKLPGYSPV